MSPLKKFETFHGTMARNDVFVIWQEKQHVITAKGGQLKSSITGGAQPLPQLSLSGFPRKRANANHFFHFISSTEV